MPAAPSINWTSDMLATIRRMSQKNAERKRIAKAIGVSLDALNSKIARDMPECRIKRGNKLVLATLQIQPDVEDTRSRTGKIMGDPLPGRSALDKRQPKPAPKWWERFVAE